MVTVKYILLFLTTLASNIPPLTNDGFCSIRNFTTQHGEQINYTVYYSVAGIYVEAGSAKFTNQLEHFGGRPVYHVVGEGRTNSSYDWIYKVKDRYESFIDTSSMQPLKFSRSVEEGKTRKKEQVLFYPASGTVVSDSGTKKVPPCMQDVLSTIYYARNIDFSKYKVGEKVPFKMFLENEVHHLYIRYQGVETIKTKYGRFSAIKFRPLLVEGTIFSGGEGMTVWVSNDWARIPVRIESKILIGSIKVDMTGYKNVRYPLVSLKKS